MELIGSRYTDYTIRGIIRDTSYIITDSAVDDMRDSLHIPMGEVTISMFYVICLCILHYALPKSFFHWKVCYIYFLSRVNFSNSPKLYLFLCWFFLHLIMVSVLLYLCMLYNRIVGYTSTWYFVLYLLCAWIIPPLKHS